MHMNLILENTAQVKYFTYMTDVFSALSISCTDYDWYISDIETNGYLVDEGWYSGESLDSLIQGNKIQFIWAVFTAFPIGTKFDVTEKPYIDGNPDYWNGSNPEPQLDRALFEIGCWDSSATILVGVPSQLAENFMAIYTDTRELDRAAR
ncbi:hypothetical protein K6Q96_18220 [Grimontia kaedaensis]|uniref:Uncharacterized protein n=1 Tax=Grimontia kaedaensis TaxID=2872157 RepID=A0ABY4X1S9_9GAMM|nr:hypothetical protein [Grimontia kaedaensis]USH05157.1 hypothetical protein K6Q96_18220 [Grimontia kaedaensis]